MTDIVIHAGTKLALWQWLEARGLGETVQDTDPSSSTFGEWSYRHTNKDSTFLFRNHPSGKVELTYDNTDPEDVLITYMQGFYGVIRFRTIQDATDLLGAWTQNNTATSILEVFQGIGGEGITFVEPSDVEAHIASIGATPWQIAGGMTYKGTALWYFGLVLFGDERDFDGQTYIAQRDIPDGDPTEYPDQWQLKVVAPAVSPWVQPTGAQDAYAIDDEVTHDNPNDGGNIWLYRSKIAANTTEPGRDATFDRWWEPVEAV